jgi:hypothetical protein
MTLSLRRRRPARQRPVRRPAAHRYYDPYFADPGAVEDDYRRLTAGRGRPGARARFVPGLTTPKA